jgi:hypothetical protein
MSADRARGVEDTRDVVDQNPLALDLDAPEVARGDAVPAANRNRISHEGVSYYLTAIAA